jgi:hypothetical protein
MTLFIIFIVSGAVVASLLLAKLLEQKTRKSFLPLSLISKGDAQVREMSHSTAELYSDFKEHAAFFVRKQLPLHAKSLYYKSLDYSKERMEYYIGNIRGSRLLKKSDGISEFFRSIEIEKGAGEIHDTPHVEEVK